MIRRPLHRSDANMKLILPYPPSANRYWRNVNGRMVKSAEARAYKTDVVYHFLTQMRGQKPLESDVYVTLNFYRPRRRGDLDNRIKVTLDSLQGLAFKDDSQISVIHAARFEDKNDPRVEVHVGEAAVTEG